GKAQAGKTGPGDPAADGRTDEIGYDMAKPIEVESHLVQLCRMAFFLEKKQRYGEIKIEN
ncbi:MAG: hypothetical protein NC121_20435, partial [Blautia sp.]|nr:hypothetical protein [Blautia sp.]